MAKKEDTLYLQIPLEEMQRLYTDQKAGLDTIKTNIRAILSAASLIVAMISALQIYTNRIAPEWVILYGVGVIIAAVLYVALIIVCIFGLWPAHIIGPIQADWVTLASTYKGLSEQATLELRLSAVLNAIELNGPIVNHYKWLSMVALVLLPLIVTILLLLTLVPRV